MIFLNISHAHILVMKNVQKKIVVVLIEGIAKNIAFAIMNYVLLTLKVVSVNHNAIKILVFVFLLEENVIKTFAKVNKFT